MGIPCRLVKGSHYTGTDEGAVNIVKLESDRLETVIKVASRRCFFVLSLLHHLIFITALCGQSEMMRANGSESRTIGQRQRPPYGQARFGNMCAGAELELL